MATNQQLCADDTENDPRVDRDACRRIGLRSMILLPLRYGERSFGVLKLMSKRVSAFTADAEHTLRLMGQFLGVTIARKRTEEALRESEARLQAVLDGSPDPIFVKDREGRLVLANPATYAVIGKPAEACLGKTDEQFLDNPADGRAIMANDRRIMASGQAETVEEMISTPSGTRYYVSNKAPCRDAAGNVIGLIGTARDVTERKQAEQALQANAKRLAGVLDAQQEIASSHLDYAGLRDFILERMTRLVAADGACLELAEGDELVYEAASGLAAGFTGLRVKKGASLSGLSMTSNQMLRSDDTETDPRVDREACRRIGLRSMVVMPLRYDERTFGVLKLMSARVAAFTAELEQALRLMGEFLGMTIARQRAQEARRASEERLRAIVGTAVDAIIVIDEDGIVQSANPAAERIFGYAPGEIVGKNVSILMPGPHSSAHQGYIRAYLRTGDAKIIGKGCEVDGRCRKLSSVPT